MLEAAGQRPEDGDKGRMISFFHVSCLPVGSFIFLVVLYVYYAADPSSERRGPSLLIIEHTLRNTNTY